LSHSIADLTLLVPDVVPRSLPLFPFAVSLPSLFAEILKITIAFLFAERIALLGRGGAFGIRRRRRGWRRRRRSTAT
jgi:hypothetical protein